MQLVKTDLWEISTQECLKIYLSDYMREPATNHQQIDWMDSKGIPSSEVTSRSSHETQN